MSLTWTQDGSGNYEISSAEHLLQLMNEGTLYTDAGTSPTEYYSSSYVQTVDVDLASHHANIKPINGPSAFSGSYDGNLYNISNWSYSSTDTTERVGLFGYLTGPAKRIRLSGTWSLSGARLAGFLAGQSGGDIFDIEADFSEGTSFSQTGAINMTSGMLIGLHGGGDVYGVTVRGTISSTQANGHMGGVFGDLRVTATMCRNLAYFPNGLNGGAGKACGGICGVQQGNLFKSVNAMVGNITASEAGGIAGVAYGVTDSCVNSMTGDISGTSHAGGIVGRHVSFGSEAFSVTRALNYMTGDISGSGLVGFFDSVSGSTTLSISKSVVAMNGTVGETVRSTADFTPSPIEVTVDTSFGLQSSGNTYGLATMVSDPSLLYHADFPDLPYFTMEETDPDGTSYKWDFIYGNIGGKYPLYSHLSVHRSDVSFPLATDFDLAVTNTTTYMTYANRSDEHLYVNPSLPIIETIATGVYDRFTGLIFYIVYQKEDLYIGESDVYDISDPVVAASINENNFFTTGDNVRVSLPGASKLDTVFVKRGDTIDVSDVDAVLVPFEESVVDAQEVTIQLTDTTLVSATFDAGSGTVTLLGNTYSNGQGFLMDGKKVTVKDI